MVTIKASGDVTLKSDENSFTFISELGFTEKLPLAQYKFNADATDAMGSFDGTLSTIEPVSTTDKNGVADKAYTFDKDGNTYVTTNNSSDEFGIGVGKSYSFSAWVYPTGVSEVENNNIGYIVCKPGWHGGLHLTSNYNFRMTIQTENHTGVSSAASSAKQLDTWYHVVGTYNTDTGITNIYVNGVLEDTSTLSGIEYESTMDILLGKSGTADTGDWRYPFGGKIDNVEIWGSELTVSEVGQLYNYGAATETNNIGQIRQTLENSNVSPTLKTSSNNITIKEVI